MRELEDCPAAAVHGADFGFLPAHAYVFPATKSDHHRAEAHARVARLRAHVDGLVAERKGKEATLEEALERAATRAPWFAIDMAASALVASAPPPEASPLLP